MTRLNELINELCPDGVEYKTLGETVGVNRGKRLVKNQLSDNGAYEVYHGSKESILGRYDQYNAPANTTIVVNTGGIGGVKFLEKPFWCSDGSFWLGKSSEINSKYLYYCLSGYEDYFYSQKRVGGVPTIDRSVVEDFKIPVPPLPVQEEIVRILDKFTSLEAELEAELEARRVQYEYYRDALLASAGSATNGTFPVVGTDKNAVIEPAETTGDDEFITLKNLFNTRNGYTPSTSNSEYWENGAIPWFVMDDIRKNGRVLSDSSQHITKNAMKKSGLFPANSIIVATSATIGEHALITTDFLCNQRFTCLSLKDEFKDKVNMKYIFYYAFKLDEFCKANTTKSSFASVDMTKFNDFKFWLPPLAEQERIVKILDRFESLCNDISAGLPAEIKMRKKQYEFYRDKLLSFKEKY